MCIMMMGRCWAIDSKRGIAHGGHHTAQNVSFLLLVAIALDGYHGQGVVLKELE